VKIGNCIGGYHGPIAPPSQLRDACDARAQPGKTATERGRPIPAGRSLPSRRPQTRGQRRSILRGEFQFQHRLSCQSLFLFSVLSALCPLRSHLLSALLTVSYSTRHATPPAPSQGFLQSRVSARIWTQCPEIDTGFLRWNADLVGAGINPRAQASEGHWLTFSQSARISW
jgi:hypothetical protein